MATLQEKIDCERQALDMLARYGLPQPDHVEYGYTCIRLMWADSKTVMVVQIDEPPEGWEQFEADAQAERTALMQVESDQDRQPEALD
jgi:hypothetical protein